MKRLADLCQPSARAVPIRPGVASQGFCRRGFAQRPQRQREHNLRGNLLDLRHWSGAQGLSMGETADLLGLAPRTLRQWQLDYYATKRCVQPLGRPLLRSRRHDRNLVIELLDELGPATGLPTLQECFPSMPRAELEDILKRYRRIWQIRHAQAQHLLRWPVPGLVWAMDFTEAPRPLDGIYPYLLAVRDLASGQQLLWLPLINADSLQTLSALEPLFRLHGAPLVLKTDNGSPFCAGSTLDFLAAFGVIPLFSPPYWPRYNGAIEAGIGSLKTRTERHATLNGRATLWSFGDADAALAEANATSRPKGPTGPTAQQLWNERTTINHTQRALFQHSVNQNREHVRLTDGWPLLGPLPSAHERTIDRHAIGRALVEHGYLLFRRRRITLPFNSKKTAGIR